MAVGKIILLFYYRIFKQFFNNLPYPTFLIEYIIKINSLRIDNCPKIAIEFYRTKE